MVFRLVVARRHRVFNFSNELDPELSDVVSFEGVLDEPTEHLDVDHLQGPFDGTAKNVRVTKVVT